MPDPSERCSEFKEMVARFHDAGIEVILDVVYNHTAEGNELGPTLSFKGIDNASYYRLMPDKQRYYINDTGTGNTLNLSHPRVLQMVMRRLRYWVEEMHVDGFRFDLGTILGARARRLRRARRLLDAVRQDPVLAQGQADRRAVGLRPRRLPGRRLPARLGGVERQVPRHGARLLARRARAGASSRRASRGSADVYDRRGRRPWASVNFITAHDGFTLNDLVTYNDKHNEANGEDNKDGHSHNRSWNHGAEGPTDDEAIRGLRKRQMKNLLATLLLSQGTPMLLAGDEFGRTQNGNNNAYCQDNEISLARLEPRRARPAPDPLRAAS